jgi:hypothetical protein
MAVGEQIVQAGWRMPADVYWGIAELAAKRRTTANRLASHVLRQYLAQAAQAPEEQRREARAR